MHLSYAMGPPERFEQDFPQPFGPIKKLDISVKTAGVDGPTIRDYEYNYDIEGRLIQCKSSDTTLEFEYYDNNYIGHCFTYLMQDNKNINESIDARDIESNNDDYRLNIDKVNKELRHNKLYFHNTYFNYFPCLYITEYKVIESEYLTYRIYLSTNNMVQQYITIDIYDKEERLVERRFHESEEANEIFKNISLYDIQELNRDLSWGTYRFKYYYNINSEKKLGINSFLIYEENRNIPRNIYDEIHVIDNGNIKKIWLFNNHDIETSIYVRIYQFDNDGYEIKQETYWYDLSQQKIVDYPNIYFIEYKNIDEYGNWKESIVTHKQNNSDEIGLFNQITRVIDYY
jgi:hypothetical protein